PVRLMDQISRQLPNEVWLTGLRETGGRVTLQGFAFTDFAIAEYMTRLKRDGGLFSEVELSFSERTEVQKVPVKRFELTLRVKT
ncbi:MAG: PilN domain-containing protein, partial [candidate division NC10 bacterium]|nr:PilN domain-containing protein [candidate division NC10 bacterium]